MLPVTLKQQFKHWALIISLAWMPVFNILDRILMNGLGHEMQSQETGWAKSLTGRAFYRKLYFLLKS